MSALHISAAIFVIYAIASLLLPLKLKLVYKLVLVRPAWAYFSRVKVPNVPLGRGNV